MKKAERKRTRLLETDLEVAKSGQWKGLKNFEERDLGCDKAGATTV